MKKVNLTREYYKLGSKASKQLTKLVTKHKSIVFYTPPATEEEENMLYDCPRVTYINKHGETLSYGIVELTLNQDGKVSVKAKCTEVENDTQDFTLADLTTEDIIFLADATEDKSASI